MFNRNLFKYGACLIAITLTVFLAGCGSEDSLEPGGDSNPLIGVKDIGETLYASGCSSCHGSDAAGGMGGLGPNIQGSLPDMISATAEVGTMASVSVMDQEAADISEFLSTIETGYTYPNGEAIFTAEGGCASCHGADATGVGDAPDITSSTAEDIGMAAGTGSMVDVSIRPAQAEVLVSYIASLTGGGGGGDAELYATYCGGCHGADGKSGYVGADLTVIAVGEIESATLDGTGTMAAQNVTPEEATAIAEYLVAL